MCKIKEFRENNDYTQRYIAYMLGVSQQAVDKWENGKATPKIGHLLKLASLIGCSIEELFD